MPRQAREKSETGIYHIMMRGINRQQIFHDEEDHQRYLETLKRIVLESDADLLGYCLMGNHTHLLLQERTVEISSIMKRLGVSYAWWYNRKYDRSGHLFQDRFKSENVEEDAYLLTVIRYIHQNPVKAGIADKAEDYRWSSCRDYYGEQDNLKGITQTKMVLELLSEDQERAREIFVQYMEQRNNDVCLEEKEYNRVSDEAARKQINIILKNRPMNILQHMGKAERDETLRKIKEIEGTTLRQIARVTGLSLKIVFRA